MIRGWSWQTTLAGVAAIVVAGAVKLGYLTPEQGSMASGLVVGLLGYLAKDRSVTGGTRGEGPYG